LREKADRLAEAVSSTKFKDPARQTQLREESLTRFNKAVNKAVKKASMFVSRWRDSMSWQIRWQ